VLQIFDANLELYTKHPDASLFLGVVSSLMYRFVRQQLSVPFLRIDWDIVDDLSIGSFVTTIYRAFYNGQTFLPVMESLHAVIAQVA
jgi:hypothetical protein